MEGGWNPPERPGAGIPSHSSWAQHLGGGAGGPEAGRKVGSPGTANAGQVKGEEKGSFSETVEGGKRSWKDLVGTGAIGSRLSRESDSFAAVIFLQREQGFSPENVSAKASVSELSCE